MVVEKEISKRKLLKMSEKYIISALLALNVLIIYFESKKEHKMNKKKRPCKFRHRKLLTHSERVNQKKIFSFEDVNGLFHQWGTNIQEHENGAVQFTVGIIEDETGQIHEVIPNDVRFIDS